MVDFVVEADNAAELAAVDIKVVIGLVLGLFSSVESYPSAVKAKAGIEQRALVTTTDTEVKPSPGGARRWCLLHDLFHFLAGIRFGPGVGQGERRKADE